MSILGFFLFLIVIILVIGLSLVSSVLRFIFGIGKKASNYGKKSSQSSYNTQQSQQTTTNRKKIFEEDEGEYVEFEEVKDDENNC